MTQPATKTVKGKVGNALSFKDKRVQIGLAAAAVLGLFALVRRGQAPTEAGEGQSLNTGTLDTTGMDSYNAIAQIGQAWQDQWNQAFQDFQDSLGGIQDQLGKVNGPGAITPAPGNRPVPEKWEGQVLAIDPKKKPGTGWYKVRKGDSIYDLIGRVGFGGEDKLLALNSKRALNHLDAGEWIRIRSQAGPKPK